MRRGLPGHAFVIMLIAGRIDEFTKYWKVKGLQYRETEEIEENFSLKKWVASILESFIGTQKKG